MKILLEKIKKLEQLEKVADEAESRWTEQPESEELENAFDEAYKAEFDAYMFGANVAPDCGLRLIQATRWRRALALLSAARAG